MPELIRVPSLERDFDNLSVGNYGKHSNKSGKYNCIAFAAGVTTEQWTPEETWPEGAIKHDEFHCLESLFYVLGYRRCTDGRLEDGVEKVAIYADSRDKWTHASRQRSDGWWESKMGRRGVDIIHTCPEDVAGREYGSVVMYMSREREEREP